MERGFAERRLSDGPRGSACRALDGMETVVASVSGYHGRERFKLIKLITQTGAHYVGAMARSTTHLVCWELKGKKYDLARSIGAKILSHRWFEDCIKKGRRTSERPYVMQSGREVGPILWETPEEDNYSKRKGESSEDESYGEMNVRRDLLNTVDDARMRGNSSRQSESEVPCSRPLDMESNFSNHIEDYNFIGRRSGRLRKKNKTEFSIHPLPESSGSATMSHRREINSGCVMSNEAPQPEMDSHERNQTVDDSEDIVELNSSPDYNGYHNETALSSDGNSSQNQRGPNEASSSSDAFKSQAELSCVICWTDFSSTRGVLACGHRFCYACIKGWADCMVSKREVSTCPLCKASFSGIARVDSVASSDQKIYSQTVPSCLSDDHLFEPLVDQDSGSRTQEGWGEMVCHMCQSCEPEDQLQCCHLCRARWVHSCCLDPPVLPWTCVHCRDLRVLYQLSRY